MLTFLPPDKLRLGFYPVGEGLWKDKRGARKRPSARPP